MASIPARKSLKPGVSSTFGCALGRAPGRVLTTALCCFWGAAISAQAQDAPQLRQEFVSIATGSVSGAYQQMGKLIASIVSQPIGAVPCDAGGRCGVPGLTAVARISEGSVSNVHMIEIGRSESALVQADVANWAFHGEGAFKKAGPHTNLRAIARLYDEGVHLVVSTESGITSVSGLKGKRVSLDRSGSGTRPDAQLVLKAYKVRDRDLTLVNKDADHAADLMLKGELDAFFYVGGWPSPTIADLTARGVATVAPIDGDEALRLVRDQPFMSAVRMPAGTYDNVDAVETLAVGALWLVHADVSEALVYGIAQSLFHEKNRDQLDRGHAKGQSVRIEDAVNGISIPLHRGAARYFEEQRADVHSMADALP